MKRGPNRPRIITQDVTRMQEQHIRERCIPIIEHWGRNTFPRMDIHQLALSIYVQGLLDGVQMAQRKEVRDIVESRPADNGFRWEVKMGGGAT